MKHLVFVCSVLSMSIVPANMQLSKEEVLIELSRERYFPYQDIIVNNEVYTRGVGPDCPSRYEAIKSVLEKYDRPIKVLDIGASNGYFSLRIAHDFDALCVMADVSDRLCKICKLNNKINNLIYLKKALSLEDLKALNELEHFDVVLALNVVHHMTPYKEILDILFELGDTVIIETPPANDKRAEENQDIPLIEEYLLNKPNAKVIAKTPRAEANNFEEITVLTTNTVSYLEKKEYTPDAYAKMFCFENLTSSGELSFKETTYQLFNGVFSTLDELKK